MKRTSSNKHMFDLSDPAIYLRNDNVNYIIFIKDNFYLNSIYFIFQFFHNHKNKKLKTRYFDIFDKRINGNLISYDFPDHKIPPKEYPNS